MMIYLVPSLVAGTLEQLLPFSYNFGVAYIITRSVVRLDILQSGTAAASLTATQARRSQAQLSRKPHLINRSSTSHRFKLKKIELKLKIEEKKRNSPDSTRQSQGKCYVTKNSLGPSFI